MSPATAKCGRIRRIVRIHEMLLRWRKKARISAVRSPSSDVPAGCVAVCVGPTRRRFIVRATYLNHPIFKKLLVQAEEEYGFCSQGPLAIPCDESLFEEAVRVVSRSGSAQPHRFSSLEDLQKRCHVDVLSGFDRAAGESWPLLHYAPIS